MAVIAKLTGIFSSDYKPTNSNFDLVSNLTYPIKKTRILFKRMLKIISKLHCFPIRIIGCSWSQRKTFLHCFSMRFCWYWITVSINSNLCWAKKEINWWICQFCFNLQGRSNSAKIQINRRFHRNNIFMKQKRRHELKTFWSFFGTNNGIKRLFNCKMVYK